ncbi:TPA: hypothetical protein ACWQF8_005116 [Escherichia coli]
MRQIIDTLAQLQRLRDKSVKDKTVELAKQKQICAGYDNNIKALGYLVEKTSAGAAASVESLKNVSGYKGTLRKVIAWQEQEKTLADAPRDKCTLSCAINGIHAAFHYLKKNYISGCVMTVPTGW